MKHRRLVRWSLGVGFALGAGTIPLAYAVGPSPHGGGGLGANVIVSALPSGELAVTPAELLSRSGLTPGDTVGGSARVRNTTGVGMTVWLRARPSTRALDTSLRVRVRLAGDVLYNGTLGGLREQPAFFRLPSGGEDRLRVDASLPAQGGDAWRGQIADVALALETTPLLTAEAPRG